MTVYTYTVPNQWRTKVQSLKSGLTHYIKVCDTYLPCSEEYSRELANLYRSRGIEPEAGLLSPQ